MIPLIRSFTISSLRALKLSSGQISKRRMTMNIEDTVVRNSDVEIYFNFRVAYLLEDDRTAGRLEIDGRLDVSESQSGAEGIKGEWRSNKRLPKKLEEEVTDYLFFECESRGVLACYSVNLPPPVPMTSVRMK